MPFVAHERVLERFRNDATNSSHFVWLLAQLKYYECANGWLFAYQRVGEVTLLALEPLIPGAPAHYGDAHVQSFKEAWTEFTVQAEVKISAFVSIYEPFSKLIAAAGFSCFKVGQEPWVDLKDCIPTGNAGKGVRSARNQALAAGLTVEEWSAEEINRDHDKKHVLRQIHEEWRSTRAVELSGFMNATNPFHYMQERRYFVLKSGRRVESYLVASPVPGRKGYFLEDLISRHHAPRGAGELLTLESMVRLGESGVDQASLGVVSLTTMESNVQARLPGLIRFLMVQVPAYMSLIYNFNGMEVYRKRFKPRAWEAIHLGVKDENSTVAGTVAWLKVIFAILIAFRPRPRLTAGWATNAILTPLRRTPFTICFAAITVAMFARINHFHGLPDWALAKYGFFASATASEWLKRTVVSDLLYFDAKHFLTCALPLFALLYWGERTHRPKFFLTLMFGSILLDDVLNYWILVKPFEHLNVNMFRHLIVYKDVGGSLLLAVLVGLQICQFRLIREPLVALITLGFVLGFAFTSEKFEWLIMNLNHAIFFVLGYLLGKADFEYKRHLSRKASRGKPPVARSVKDSKQPKPAG
ncbi:MAG: DUF2156 domain-containing protein [Deltaproteobacteria bacterium]|nr:DUF2156 domain-containing protein [Deltaproteobacteria bacterium]